MKNCGRMKLMADSITNQEGWKMREETLETFYKNDEDEETATSRIRLVPDYDADVESMGIEGTVKFVENRRIQDFYDSLNYQGAEYNEEIILSDGFVFDGALYWGDGPDVREGKYFLGYKTRKEAKEYHKMDYASILEYNDGVYGFIYETKCDCCSQWEVKDSIWWITSPKQETADYWFNEFENISKKV